MSSALLSLFGGIGLFLFGMQALTDGLRALAGQGLRSFLRRFTVSPLTGTVTGAAVTAVLQSSSATVMAVIGLVGAGLMTFPQALGVILGANVGTTVTGWMVALLGLKLQLGTIALPVLFVASLAAMLGRGRLAQTGAAVSGFALIFIGLDMMQGAVVAVEPLLAGSLAAADSLGGRLVLVATGFAFTAVTQSSSAGIATVIVMLAGGAIDLVQAAVLAVGMDVGTTVKAVLTTLGGSLDMRRTALAHVGYNVLTGVIGFLVVTQVPLLLDLTGGNTATALTAFHTLLNLGGVVLVLPVIRQAARLIERMMPAKGDALTEPLDRRLLGDPITAIDAAGTAAGRIAAAQFAGLSAALRGRAAPPDAVALRGAIEDLEAFLSEIALPPDHGGPRQRLGALLHLTDHLNRLAHRAEQTGRIAALEEEPLLARPARALAALLAHAARSPADPGLAVQADRLNRLIRARSGRLRRSVLSQGSAAPDIHDLFRLTDALRWAERVSAHAARILHYAAEAAANGVRGTDPAR